MIHKLVIKDLRLDAGTQQRSVSDVIVKEYMEAIKGGEPLPAIDVMTDGKDTWPTDGFHRIIAYRKLGKDYIQANISEGTLRDAIWKSYRANTEHGFRRQPGTSKEIIKKILNDAEWKEGSLSQIARHVGVSQQFVSQVKKKMDKEKEDNKKSKKGASEPVLDSKQQEVPEHLQQYFQRADEIKQHIRYLNQMVRDIKAAKEGNDLLWANCKLDALKSNVGNLRRDLNFTLPFVVCVYCGGDVNNSDCGACNGHGFLNELQYKAAPAEMKE